MIYFQASSIKSTTIIFFCIFLVQLAFAQQRPVDKALEKLEVYTKNDRKKVDLLQKVAFGYYKISPEKTEAYARKSLTLAHTLKYQKGVAEANRMLGLFYRVRGDFKQAISYCNVSLKVALAIKDKVAIAKAYKDLATVYYHEGAYKLALQYYFKSLKMVEQLGNEEEMANLYNNIGIIYDELGNHKLSLEYYFKVLKLESVSKDKGLKASITHNTGEVYLKQGKYNLAMKYLEDALKIKKELGNIRGQANSYEGMGRVCLAQGKYTIALNYFEKVHDISKSIGRKLGTVDAYVGLGEVNMLLGRYTEAKKWLQEGVLLAKEMRAKDREIEYYRILTKLYEVQRNFKQAYTYHQKYTLLKDSVFNKQKSQQMAEMQVLYETEKKDRENQVLKNKQVYQQSQLKNQKNTIRHQWVVTTIVLVGLVLLALLALGLYRQRQQKQQANYLLSQQNEEIFTTNEILETLNVDLQAKNENITASINYAQHIQQAILPTVNQLQHILPNSFIYFRPLEVVSGDFYWFAEIKAAQTGTYDKTVLAVVDCTGHGVPGAFMSLIATVLLKEAIHLKHIYSPDLILNELHRNIRNTLKQNQNYNRDGMDVALVTIEPEIHTLEFAGAKRPLVYIQDRELHRVKGDMLPIGGEQREKERRFTKHAVYINRRTTFFLFSDGYQDQFGGGHNKKFGSQRLYDLLLKIHAKPMEEQQDILTNNFEQWKRNVSQTDDVLVLGVQV